MEENSDSWDLFPSIYDLARIGKLEIAVEIINTRMGDKNTENNYRKKLKAHLAIIEGLEKYLYGLWADSSFSMYNFLKEFSENIEELTPENWLVLFERAVYVLLSAYCKELYLPVNALNYVHEQ